MTEQSGNDITVSRSHLLKGVLIALIALLLGGGLFLAGASYGRFHPTGPTLAQRWVRAGTHGFAGRVRSFAHATYGSVKSIGTNQFDLTSNGGHTFTVTLSDNSVILDQGKVVNLTDLKAGDEVSVFGSESGTIITATRVVVNPSLGSVF